MKSSTTKLKSTDLTISVAIVTSLFVTAFLFRHLKENVVSGMSNPYSPPMKSDGYSALKDPKLGEALPLKGLDLSFPAVIVVHSECLTCTLLAYDRARLAFDTSDITNIVATEPDSYLTLIRQHPSAIVTSPEIAVSLNAMFSPRVYAFDAEGRLAFAQDQGEDFFHAVARGKSKIAPK